MTFIAWIVSTAAIAWFAGLLMRAHTQHALALSVLVGVLGSAIGHWLLRAVTGNAVLEELAGSRGLGSVLATFAGALIVLAALSLVRKLRDVLTQLQAVRVTRRAQAPV